MYNNSRERKSLRKKRRKMKQEWGRKGERWGQIILSVCVCVCVIFLLQYLNFTPQSSLSSFPPLSLKAHLRRSFFITMLFLYCRFLSILESIYRRGARRWRKLYRVNGHLFQAKYFNRVSVFNVLMFYRNVSDHTHTHAHTHKRVLSHCRVNTE